MKKVDIELERKLQAENLNADLVVVGGGMAGACCAITAARKGVKVVLIQDRPVLGGNASSEVRLWVLGATSHMGNNNRWAREGGVIDEILVENTYRNPEGNPVLFDTILLEKVVMEPGITLLLNTAVYDLEKEGPDQIKKVRAYCSQNETHYEVEAPLFCDASGDGVIGFLSGAAFRIGAEGRDEFGEGFAPQKPAHDLLGHTIYFYSKETAHPVKFVPPRFALTDITKIPRWRDIRAGEMGCRFWWLEWGGGMDTIHETEKIKWELWRVVYGVWNHIKNSGQFPEAEKMTLEWVGTIPGKRESRRFEGDYMLHQRDVIEQRLHEDAVSYGGWAIDLHPSDGVYSPESPCIQWHSKGVYQIPYRTLYSRNIKNLFLSGRLISASHIAFGSTRVMATSALNGQVVGMAAAQGKLPAQVDVRLLQKELLGIGHSIPGVVVQDPQDLSLQAKVSASSELRLAKLKANGEKIVLSQPWAMMIPVRAGEVPRLSLFLDVDQSTVLNVELRQSSKLGNHTPDVTLERLELPLVAGTSQRIDLHFKSVIDSSRYLFLCLMTNEAVKVHLSDDRVTGILSVTYSANKAVAKTSTQLPPENIGIETFEFWIPQRRPKGKNFAMEFSPSLDVYKAENLLNGLIRPVDQPNAWAASLEDRLPFVKLEWAQKQLIRKTEISFDTDYDHPMESSLMNQPERVMPFCIQNFEILDDQGKTLLKVTDHHQTRFVHEWKEPLSTSSLTLRCEPPSSGSPAAIFEWRCYA